MGTNPKCVEFTFDWSLRWTDYDRIGKGMARPRYYFVTSFNNVSFRWYATMFSAKEAAKNEFCMCYDDGPLDAISGVDYKIGVVKSDQSLSGILTTGIRDYVRTTDKGSWGWPRFEDNDATAVRSKYGLTESDRLTYQISIKIPVETFAYCIPSPTPASCSPWLVKLFDSINNAEESSLYPDTKIAGRDGIVFNCHKGIVAAQSDALKTIFRYPPSDEGSGEVALEDEEQSVANPPKKRKLSAMEACSVGTQCGGAGIYDFPNLSAASMKSVLEYLYTGNVTTPTLTVNELIEVGDAGEQYDLKALKEFSAAELWKRVVIEEPASAFEIARFADLHDELKYLKHRALDVIAQNYDHLGVKADELAKRFGGTRGKELHGELTEYMGRRLRPSILP